MVENRLRLVSVTVAGHAASGVSVIVADGGNEVVGAAAGIGGAVERTAARATLRAVESLTGEPLHVVAVSAVELGEIDVAVVSVRFGTELMIGTAEIGIRTAAEAFSRATLDAVNRIIGGAEDAVRQRRHQLVYRSDEPAPGSGLGQNSANQHVRDE